MSAAACITTATAGTPPNLQRWLNRDPIEENGGINLYAFGFNRVPNGYDSDGRYWSTPSFDPIGRPGPGVQGSGCAGRIARDTLREEHNQAAPRWRYAHCMASCKIAKECGQFTAIAAGLAKEVGDLVACLLTGRQSACDSAFQPSDIKDNSTGRNCPEEKSCEEACESLRDLRDAPPGIFRGWPVFREIVLNHGIY
jgi:hypothetical protein